MIRSVHILLVLILSLPVTWQTEASAINPVTNPSQSEIQRTDRGDDTSDYPSDRGILLSSESQGESGIQTSKTLKELCSFEETEDEEGKFKSREYVSKQLAFQYEWYAATLVQQQFVRQILFPFHSFL